MRCTGSRLTPFPKRSQLATRTRSRVRSDVSFFLWHAISDFHLDLHVHGPARAHLRWLQNRGRAALSTSHSAAYLGTKRRTCNKKQGLPTFGRMEWNVPFLRLSANLGSFHSPLMPCPADKVLFCVLCGAAFFHGCRPSVENVEDVDLPGPWGWRGPQQANRSDHATISNFETRPHLGDVTMDLSARAICSSPLLPLDIGQWSMAAPHPASTHTTQPTPDHHDPDACLAAARHVGMCPSQKAMASVASV